MDYTLEISTEPEVPSALLTNAKRHLRIEADEGYEDILVSELLAEAVDYIGDRSDISMLPTTFKLTLPGFPVSSLTPIYLPRPPLVSVSSINYLDVDGAAQSITIADDIDVTSGQVSMIHLKPGKVWPSTICRDTAVSITYVSGVSIPKKARRAILLLVAHWYLNREDTSEKRLSNIPHGVDAIIYQLQPGDDFRQPIENAQSSETY